MTKEEQRTEALSRATTNSSVSNYAAIYAGFEDKGIPEGDIHPRVNVFTYRAWQAKGRQVKRGQRGVKVHTWIPVKRKEKQANGEEVVKSFKTCRTATVFHVSQTEAMTDVAAVA